VPGAFVHAGVANPTPPAHHPPVQRVLLIGPGGAGKSTLAREIGTARALPVIHLDALYWRDGWVPTPDEAWEVIVRALVARPAWVLDGNFGGTLPLRLAACDTVIYLDQSPWRCTARVVRRWVTYRGRSRPDMAPGCPERPSAEFLRWIWRYRATRRPRVLAALAAARANGKTVHVLRSPRDVRGFLASLGSHAPPDGNALAHARDS
jgi:adenylate kinase family enzyme